MLYDAVIVGQDKVGDVALVKLLPKKEGEPFPYVPLGDSDAVRAGVAVAVAAVPEGLPLVATVAQQAAARRRRGIHVLVTIAVPASSPIDAALPEAEGESCEWEVALPQRTSYAAPGVAAAQGLERLRGRALLGSLLAMAGIVWMVVASSEVVSTSTEDTAARDPPDGKTTRPSVNCAGT